MAFAPGTLVGSYEIISRLGSGGMGEVWRARDRRLDRDVAIKVADRLVHEARAIARLNHPNIVTVHEIGEHEGVPYIVMECVDGKPLSACIPDKGMPQKEALRHAIAMGRSLEAAHKAGILHRDLKPSNVMVTNSGDVKLLDFGLAKRFAASEAEETVTQTASGQIVGTIAYMSPEQTQGNDLDARSDIFSFGSVLYEMLSGRRAFDGEKAVVVLAAILHSEPVPLAGVSPELARVVERCLRKEADRRFQSAADLRATLEDLQAVLQSGRAEPVTAKRRPQAWIAAGVAVAIAAAVVAWMAREREPPLPAAPVQLTFDAGVATWPAVSPDGKLLAFASDRGEPGNVDIWLRQFAGGGVVRLTSQPGAEVCPQFTPDGTHLMYLGGDNAIYEMPALGGPSRKVLDNAGPFSVSARGEIAFHRYSAIAQGGPLFAVSTGGTAEALQPECHLRSRPTWSPDGTRILFLGRCGADRAMNWFDVPRSGTGRSSKGAAPGLSIGTTAAWSDAEPLINSKDANSSFRWTSGKRALTLRNAWWPALAPDGTIVYSELERVNRIRSVATATNGDVASEPADVAGAMGHFAVSLDGSTLVYGRLISADAGELVIRDLKSGAEKVYASHQLLGVSIGSLWPQASPNGKQVFYRVVGKDAGHYLLNAESGELRRIATLEQFGLASEWSTRGGLVTGECGQAAPGICEIDLASGQVRRLAAPPEKQQLLYPSWSADRKRVSFMRRYPGGATGIWTAPVNADGTVTAENQWIEIAPAVIDNSRPRFSFDGRTLYYVAGRMGQRVLAVQKLDASGRADGNPAYPVREELETPLVSGGTGPYPLIQITRDRLYYSNIGARGALFAYKPAR